MERFGVRLRRAMDKHGQLCVGIDPHDSLLRSWGFGVDPDGLERFAAATVEAFAGEVAVVKPQSAFFERFGARGIGILESIIRQFRSAGTLVLLDVKRGDIGSTMSAYATAYLDPSSSLYVDAITVSPYLGVGALAPAFEAAAAGGAGVFVLALTSNPEGRSVQFAKSGDGRTVAQAVIDEISQLNAGVAELGDLGLVVGASAGRTGHDLSRVGGPLLVPGMGAQGGRPDDLRALGAENRSAILPSYSREILSAGPDPEALRAAARAERDACRAVLTGPE